MYRRGVRRDVERIKDFYTLVSGETVELNRFMDFSAMAAAAGFKFRARKMTALEVQVVGTVPYKNVFTGDGLWGLPWLSSLLVSRSTGLEIYVLNIYATLFSLES